LKEILFKQRKVDEHETVALGEECRAVALNTLPAKLKDPSGFSIPCMIGRVRIDRALCDLGSSVSLMPYSIFKTLGLRELSPISISLQLADHFIKYPLGVLEDVSIKVGEDSRTQIILGRPFLATTRCKIDVQEGKLTFDAGEHHAEFGLFKESEFSPSTFSYCGCKVLEPDEPVSMLDITQNDPFSLDYTLFKGQ